MPAISLKRSLIAASLMLLTLGLIKYTGHVEAVPPVKSLSSFPTQIGDWIGREERFDERVYRVLGVDDSFLCNYKAPDGRGLQLYVGYYASQREGELSHSPRNCMPGAGWSITSTRTEEIPVQGVNPGGKKVARLVVENAKERQIVLYWFQSRGRFIASEYWQKIYLVWDSIFKNRTDGAFVRLTAPVTRDVTLTTEYVKRFAEDVIPILQEYLPGARLRPCSMPHALSPLRCFSCLLMADH